MKRVRAFFNGLCKLSVFAAAFALGHSSEADVLPVETSSNVGTGFWMGKFADATNLAQRASAPMVLFWANEGCTECAKLEAAVNTPQF